MEGQQESITLSGHLVPIMARQQGPDHMVMHIYGLVHDFSVLHVAKTF